MLAEEKVVAKPALKQQRALIWSVIAGVLAGILLGLRTLTAGSGSDQSLASCYPFAGAFAGFLMLLVGSMILHQSATYYTGRGERYDFMYCFSMILAPAMLAAGLLIGIGQLSGLVAPVLNQIILLITIILMAYPAWLSVLALQAVETVPFKVALGIVLIPMAIIVSISVLLIFHIPAKFIIYLMIGITIITSIIAAVLFKGVPYTGPRTSYRGRRR
jgi:hypothetical protein